MIKERPPRYGAPGERPRPTYSVLVRALRATAVATVLAPPFLIALSAVLLFLGLVSAEHTAAHRWLGASGIAVFAWLVVVAIFSERR